MMLASLLSRFRKPPAEKPRYVQPGPPWVENGVITYPYTVPPMLWEELSPAMQKDVLATPSIRIPDKGKTRWLASHRFCRAASEWWATPIGQRLPGSAFTWWNTASNFWIGGPTPATDDCYEIYKGDFYTVWHVHRFYGDGHDDEDRKRMAAVDGPEYWEK